MLFERLGADAYDGCDNAVSRKRSAKQKLIGWGILLVAAIVIAGLFLVTRGTSPSAPTVVATANAEPAKTSSLPASSAAAPAVQATGSSSPATTTSSPAAGTPSQAPASTPEVALVDATAMDQQSRKAMLLRLIEQGVFTGVQAVGSPPKVGVTPLFQGLDPKLQAEFAALVYAYVNNGAAGTETLQLVDAQTGSTAGTYTADTGLKLL